MRAWVPFVLAVGLVLVARADGPAPASHGVPEAWLVAMQKAEVTHPARVLLHASHTCTLRVGGEPLEVVDVREILPDMASPRGVNHIVVLDAKPEVVKAIRYVDERPLRCEGERLLLWAPLDLYDGTPMGNVLVFSKGGRSVSATEVPLSALR